MRPSSVRLILLLVPALCVAQAPRIGVLEIFGARKTPVQQIQKVAGVAPGGRLPSSKGAVEDALLGLGAIQSAALEATCCDSGQIILYVGVAEKGSATAVFREPPPEEGGPEIPEAVTKAYQRFLHEVNQAARAGVVGEDLTKGHSLMTYGPAREAQEAFIRLAEQHKAELRSVLRQGSSEDHRAMAAYVMGYHPDKQSVIEDLTYALRDSDSTVRGNAARALAAIATYAQRMPITGIRVEATAFTEMLNSPVWTDRNNAAVALVNLTESRNTVLLSELRKHALDSLVEMARWKHLPHALPAYILLGRTAWIPEADLQSAWAKGERERIIARAAQSPSSTQSTRPDHR
jgi:hypothetical protein